MTGTFCRFGQGPVCVDQTLSHRFPQHFVVRVLWPLLHLVLGTGGGFPLWMNELLEGKDQGG